jgi:hypothetical protein
MSLSPIEVPMRPVPMMAMRDLDVVAMFPLRSLTPSVRGVGLLQ